MKILNKLFNKKKKCKHCWHRMNEYKIRDKAGSGCALNPHPVPKADLNGHYMSKKVNICCHCFKSKVKIGLLVGYVSDLDWWPETKENQRKMIEKYRRRVENAR